MLAAGVKFRKAPPHTCDQHNHKIRIPKFNDNDLIDVYIQRTGMIETKGALLVRCVKQEIEGITIPRGYEIWIPGGCLLSVQRQYSSSPFVHVSGWKMNQILRTMVIDKLRNNG